MKLNKGNILVTINLIYFGTSKRVGQLRIQYTKNILLVVKTFTYVRINQSRNDSLSLLSQLESVSLFTLDK